MRSRFLLSLIAAFWLSLFSAHAQAAAILLDNFSSSNPGNYTWYRFYPSVGGGNGFNVAGGVLDPTSPANQTHGYTWKNHSLSPGESMSVDVSIDAAATQSGVRLTESIFGGSGSGDSPHFLLFDRTSPTTFRMNFDHASIPLTGNMPNTSFSTLTIARGNGALQNVITWTVSGLLSGTSSYTHTGLLATKELYFSLESFTGGGASTGRFDNLYFTAVPEPASLGMLLFGGIGLWFIRRGGK